MIIGSPNIIFNLDAHTPWSGTDKSAFFRCADSRRNIIDYVTRQSSKLGESNAFNADGVIEDNMEYIEKLQNTNSIVWSSVMSFTPEYAAQFCHNKELAQQLIKKNLAALFKDTDYDINNIDWFGAFHTNTDNPHIHLLFFEKEKTKYYKGEPAFNNKFKLPLDNIKSFVANINRENNPYSMPAFNLRDEIRRELNIYCKQPVMLLNFASAKLQDIKGQGHFQYERLNSKDKKIIDCFVQEFINSNDKASKKYDEYSSFLLSYQAHNVKMYKDNHLAVPAKINEFYDKRMSELHNRLGNTFLKALKNYDKKKPESITANKYIGTRKFKFAQKGLLTVAAQAQRMKKIGAAIVLKTLMEQSIQQIDINMQAFLEECKNKSLITKESINEKE